MPIKIEYQPSAAPVGESAYAGGLGRWRKFQQQMQLQYDQMAQQAAMQQRSIAAQQASQGFAAQRGAYENAADRQLRAHLAGMGLAAENARFAGNRKFEVEDRDFAAKLVKERDAAIAARMAEDDLRRDAAARVAADELALRAAEDDRRSMIIASYDRGDRELSAASKLKLQEIVGQLTSVDTDETWTDAQKAKKKLELERQYWNILEHPSPPVPGTKPPTPDEVAGGLKASVKFDDGTVVNGFLEKRAGGTVFRPHEPKPPAGGIVPFNMWIEDHTDDTIEETSRDEYGDTTTAKRLKTHDELIEDWRREMELKQLTPSLKGEKKTPPPAPQNPPQGRQYSEDELGAVPGEPQMGGGPDTSGPGDAPDPVAEMAQEVLPRPKTPEEAMAMAKASGKPVFEFIDPNGVPRRIVLQ